MQHKTSEHAGGDTLLYHEQEHGRPPTRSSCSWTVTADAGTWRNRYLHSNAGAPEVVNAMGKGARVPMAAVIVHVVLAQRELVVEVEQAQLHGSLAPQLPGPVSIIASHA